MSVLSGKSVLIISPEFWQWQYVSKHHYAIALAQKGSKVYFLNPPNSNLKEIDIKPTKYKNLYEVNAPQVAKGLRFFPKFLRIWAERNWLEKFEKLVKEEISAVWLFENSRFYNMEFAKNRLKIYHQVDMNQNFHIKEAASSADVCFATSDYILKGIKKYNQKAYKIHHGVNLNNSCSLDEKYEKFFAKKRIRVVLVGNLDIKYLDLKLLEDTVSAFSDIEFHLVGSYKEDGSSYKALKKYANIIWWGRVESSLIIPIINRCDICVVMYKAKDEFEKAQLSNPHKIMEYIASGKVTVATYTDEYKDKRDLLVMVDDSKNYLQKFKEVIENLEFYNSKEKQELRKAFAKEHSYEKQIEKIFNLIKQFQVRGLCFE